MTEDSRPDFELFHQSISAEVNAIKDRVRSLVQHWPTDGAFREVVLRNVIRRHLPATFHIGRGFIVTKNSASTEIDILIIDANAPTLFRDGDLFIVTPHAVRAIIEVKSKLEGPAGINAALTKIADNVSLCRPFVPTSRIWSGLFSLYGESNDHQHKNILHEIQKVRASNAAKIAVKSVAWGQNTFVRFWESVSSPENEDLQGTSPGNLWRSYDLNDLAPSYFIGNLLLSLAEWSVGNGEYAWFPQRGGKESKKRYEIGFNDPEPRACHS